MIPAGVLASAQVAAGSGLTHAYIGWHPTGAYITLADVSIGAPFATRHIVALLSFRGNGVPTTAPSLNINSTQMPLDYWENVAEHSIALYRLPVPEGSTASFLFIPPPEIRADTSFLCLYTLSGPATVTDTATAANLAAASSLTVDSVDGGVAIGSIRTGTDWNSLWTIGGEVAQDAAFLRGHAHSIGSTATSSPSTTMTLTPGSSYGGNVSILVSYQSA